jgi:hypothetical protein
VEENENCHHGIHILRRLQQISLVVVAVRQLHCLVLLPALQPSTAALPTGMHVQEPLSEVASSSCCSFLRVVLELLCDQHHAV